MIQFRSSLRVSLLRLCYAYIVLITLIDLPAKTQASPTSAALSSQILDLQASLDAQSQVLRRLVRHLELSSGKDKDKDKDTAMTMLRPRPRVSISRSLSPGQSRSSYDGEGDGEDDVVDGFEKAQRRMRREVKGASGALEVGVGPTVNGDAVTGVTRWKGKERERDNGGTS